MQLTFLGGAETVTGSKILLEINDKKILIDCGLFQGLKELRSKNWDQFPVNPASIDVILLTHAHLDHCGYIPVLVKNGFNGTIYCTPPTFELTKIILLDSAKIQEEECAHCNKYEYTKHKPAKPLYTVTDAVNCFPSFKTIEYKTRFPLFNRTYFEFHNSGHILGSASVKLDVANETIVFSGDLGRKVPIILREMTYLTKADYIVMESTYGNKEHPELDVKEKLLETVLHTYKKGGNLIIPTFSVERAQELIYLFKELQKDRLLPPMPIYLDSPMGVNATQVYYNYQNYLNLNEKDLAEMIKAVQLIKSVEISKAVIKDKKQKIVMAGSGMVTGGRILHHLKKNIGDPRNTILLVGFQAVGTRGRALLEGEKELKFMGEYHQVKAEVKCINAFSGHADQSELLDWLQHFEVLPKEIYLNHGETHQSNTLCTKIKTTLQTNCKVVKMNTVYDLY
ncbi:MAG: MBL fold metallo-hydrolase [Flavobacteriaceae bacterium]|nr:MBL fold metallo-hydrolase [Flavobacteriaceae bacterium]